MTISLKIIDVPEYLKLSKLYDSLLELDNKSFDVPIEMFKKEIIINTFDDLIVYIRIFNYWMINYIPNDFYDWVFDNKDKINTDLLNDIFPMNDIINDIKIIINTPNHKDCCILKNSHINCI